MDNTYSKLIEKHRSNIIKEYEQSKLSKYNSVITDYTNCDNLFIEYDNWTHKHTMGPKYMFFNEYIHYCKK